MLRSLLDNDLYKFTMQQAVLELYPDAWVTYEFISRKSVPVNQNFVRTLRENVAGSNGLRLQASEQAKLANLCPFLKPSYLGYLGNYSYDPGEVKIVAPDSEIFNLSDVKITIEGPWHSTILWEVPLLALISEIYFKTVDTNWYNAGTDADQESRIQGKGQILSDAGAFFADFGTRRRRSFESQERVVRNLVKYKGCVGTSNVYLALLFGTKAIGTMAHEWIMGVSALESLRHANRFALHNWDKVYQGDLGIALTDTFGTPAFFEDFDRRLARMFDGVRHDSGDPFKFAYDVVAHYKSLGIDPSIKTIVFSDGLDCAIAVELKLLCDNLGIRCSFGIGTHFTNDYPGSPALNMVIKLRSVRKNRNGQAIQVVKLSDVPTKATGDADALRVANWMFFNTAL